MMIFFGGTVTVWDMVREHGRKRKESKCEGSDRQTKGMNESYVPTVPTSVSDTLHRPKVGPSTCTTTGVKLTSPICRHHSSIQTRSITDTNDTRTTRMDTNPRMPAVSDENY